MQSNLGNIDRGLRAPIGVALIGATLLDHIGAWGWLGLVPLLTAVWGFCPAYLPFGLSTRGHRR